MRLVQYRHTGTSDHAASKGKCYFDWALNRVASYFASFVQGEVVDLIRDGGKTEVIVNEGAVQASYTLDEGLIEFGTAMEDADFVR